MLKGFISVLILAFFWGFVCFETARGGEEKSEEIKNRLNQEKSELRAIQKKIKEKRNRIQETTKKEEKVISELNRIEKELSCKQRDLKQYELNLRKKKQEIEDTNNEIEKLNLEITRQETNLASHIRTLYKLSRTGMTQAVFSSHSFSELIRRYEYFTRVIDFNLGVVTDYSKKLDLVERHKQKLENNEKKLAELTKKTRSIQKKIIRHQKEKSTLLARVKAEKELHLKALEELERASSRLQALIDKLEKGTISKDSLSASFGGKSFFSLKGRLALPVEGRVITYFGKHEDPKFSTVSFNKGIEIVAKMGSPIKAVLDGTVIYSDWFKGYGNIIIIDHGDGYYTISGHASELFKKVGDQVKPEETIGLVGDTGSLKGPNLYFEIRHHGQPLNPLEWIKQN